MIKDKNETGRQVSENRLTELLDEIRKQRMQPEDRYEIAAILESFGWNDAAAAEAFGVRDIFELADQLWDASQAGVLVAPAARVAKKSFLQYIFLFTRHFLRGMIFALPMAVSVVAMLTLRFSLWSYQYLSLENATSIAIGTLLSFVAIGGFTQAIAYWGFKYTGQDQYYMARQLVFYYVKLGYVLCLIGAVGFLLFSAVFAVFPWRMTLIIALYFLFLSAIWLSVTIMYILQKELTFTGLFIGGILLVFILFKLLKLNIILSQVIALSSVALAGVLIARHFFIQAEKAREQGINPPLPRLSVVFHISVPYFVYGILYFTFIFVDRVVAWSTNNVYMPFLIWFRGEYELGLDIALIVLILPMGLIEAVASELMANLEANRKNFIAGEANRMNQMYVSVYVKRIVYVVFFSLVNALALYLFLNTLNQRGILGIAIVLSNTSRFVFIWALVAYAIVSVALMNALLLFCLSQPQMVYRSVLFACGTNMVLGFLLSRWVDYSWAVFGLLVGALVFAAFSSRQVLKVLRGLDYYLYSAS